MSEDNRAKRFDDFNKLTAEKKQQELWLIGDMNKGTLRDIAKNVGTMREQLDALVTTTVKNEFQSPVIPSKPVSAPVQKAIPVNAPPARQPDPVQPEEPSEKPAYEQGKWYNLEGTMKDDPTLRKGTSKAGKDWKLASFRVDLPTETVKVTLWNDLATEAMQYVAGERLALNDMVVKEFYEGTPQFNSGNHTKITVLPQ